MHVLQKLNCDFVEMLPFIERPFKAKFVPNKIWNDLDKYRYALKGLCHYTKKWKTRVEVHHIESECIVVGGEYDGLENRCFVHISYDLYSDLNMNDNEWNWFKFRFIQVMMHELIHSAQASARDCYWSERTLNYIKTGDESIDSEREYLSSFDEIQAYAHCVYLEIRNKRKTVPVERFLLNNKTRSITVYNRAFGKAMNPIKQELYKQIIRWDKKYRNLNNKS